MTPRNPAKHRLLPKPMASKPSFQGAPSHENQDVILPSKQMNFLTIDHAFPLLHRVTSSQIYTPRVSVSRRYPVYTSPTDETHHYPQMPMGQPEITRDLFAHESKTELDPRTSVHSVDDVTPSSTLESPVQLFESEPASDERSWRPGVRDWLVFICIVILAMMDAFDATVLIPVLPVGCSSRQAMMRQR